MKLSDKEYVFLMTKFPINEMPDDIVVSIFSDEELTDEQVALIQPMIQRYMSSYVM